MRRQPQQQRYAESDAEYARRLQRQEEEQQISWTRTPEQRPNNRKSPPDPFDYRGRANNNNFPFNTGGIPSGIPDQPPRRRTNSTSGSISGIPSSSLHGAPPKKHSHRRGQSDIPLSSISTFAHHTAVNVPRSHSSQHNRRPTSDLELARRMQQLEDIGMGHQNNETTALEMINADMHVSVRSDITAHNLHDFPRDDEIPRRVESAPPSSASVVSASSYAHSMPDPTALSVPASPSKNAKRKKKRFFGLGNSHSCTKSIPVIHGVQPEITRVTSTPSSVGVPSGIPSGIPAAIPPPPPRGIPASIPPAPLGGPPKATSNHTFMGTNQCCVCGLSHGPFLQAFDLKYHPECFRCASCSGKIDSNDPFKYTTDEGTGKRLVYHRECFLSFGTKCVVCAQTIPVNEEGRVPFIKHAFFESQFMCTHHHVVRRCHSCQRFEPQGAPFLDLMDAGRCVCPACFRTIRLDQSDVQPLWRNVLVFLEKQLDLPIWGTLRDINVIVVGSKALHEQMMEQCSPHSGSSAMQSVSLFDTKGTCVGICLLTGLPQHQAGSALAHEALHIWLRGHPQFSAELPSMVEEGLAVLTSVLYLDHQTTVDTSPADDNGPSDEKLRQYLKFCVERDTSEIFGTGYRKAAKAYRDIGMEALVTHVLQYGDFPDT